MDAANSRLQIIYIGGSTRSGSTIVDMLLGMNTSTLAVGEINLLFRQVLKTDDPVKCSCGASLRECSLWSEVLARFHAAFPSTSLEQADLITRQIETFPQSRDAHRYWEDYVRIWRVVFAAIAEISHVSCIVDSSKTGKGSLRRPLSLARAGYDVYLLHMMRDPRAVTWSNMRRDLNKGRLKGRHATLAYAAFSSLHWCLTNVSTQAMYRSQNLLPYQRVRYEDFMEQPIASLREIEQKFLLDLQLPIDIVENNADIDSGHLASGNELRFHMPLRLQKQPQTWKSALPKPAKLGLLMSLPVARFYDYHVTNYR